MWSFSDNLNFKLEFESPFEVTFVSFCPYDSNVLIGGSSNGQIVIWDLQNRVNKLDWEEVLTANQIRYRMVMNDFLKWTIRANEDTVVKPAVISALEVSQKSTITSIHWLGKEYFVNSFGKISQDRNAKSKHCFFLTSALDGTISFWNLNAQKGKVQNTFGRKDLPKALKQNYSSFKEMLLVPVFTVASNEPLSGVIADSPTFKCKLINRNAIKTSHYNFPTELVALEHETAKQSVLTASLFGKVSTVEWLSTYTDTDAREIPNTTLDFAHFHDGPVVAMRRNNFLPSLFISIGRSVFAV